MKNKNLFNIIDILFFMIFSICVLYGLYLYSESRNSYAWQHFIFPMLGFLFIVIAGVKLGLMIIKSKQDVYVGAFGKLFNNILLKSKRNFPLIENEGLINDIPIEIKEDENNEEDFSLVEKKVQETVEQEIDQDKVVEEVEKVEEKSNVSEFYIDKDNYY